jgi:hypothetical protein
MLVPVSEHSHNIYRYLLHKTFTTEDSVRDWFEIAAGIESISYNSALFDDNSFACNGEVNKLFDKGKCCNDKTEGIKAVYSE